MTEIVKIRISDRISVQVENNDIIIFKNGHIRCSGVWDSIDYLEFHCYFNDISKEEFYSILEAFQNYYTSNILLKNRKEQSELTSLLCEMHYLYSDKKYCTRFFRKLVRDKKFRNNYQFWDVIFDGYYGSNYPSIVKLAYRRLLRMHPYNKNLWSNLAEFYDISCRSALVKKILNDIEKGGCK